MFFLIVFLLLTSFVIGGLLYVGIILTVVEKIRNTFLAILVVVMMLTLPVSAVVSMNLGKVGRCASQRS